MEKETYYLIHPDIFEKLKKDYGYTSSNGYDYNNYVRISLSNKLPSVILDQISNVKSPEKNYEIFLILDKNGINYTHTLWVLNL